MEAQYLCLRVPHSNPCRDLDLAQSVSVIADDISSSINDKYLSKRVSVLWGFKLIVTPYDNCC